MTQMASMQPEIAQVWSSETVLSVRTHKQERAAGPCLSEWCSGRCRCLVGQLSGILVQSQERHLHEDEGLHSHSSATSVEAAQYL